MMQQYTDKNLTCVDCGGTFLFSADDQEFYARKGFTNEPKRCKLCRDKRKMSSGEGRERTLLRRDLRRLRQADAGSLQSDQRQAGLLPRVLLRSPLAAGLLSRLEHIPYPIEPRHSPGLFLLSSSGARTLAAKLSPPETAPRPAGSVASAIGATPLVELPRFARGAARLFAKLEWFNPGGSVKDRIARAMVDDAEARGLLAPGRNDRRGRPRATPAWRSR